MALKKPSELFENNGNDSSRESEGENRQEEAKVNRRVVSPKELFGEIVEEEVVVEETPVEEVVEVKAEETKEDITELVQEKIGQQTEAIQEKLKEKFDEYSEKFEDRTKKYYQNLTNQFNSVKENLIKKVSNLEVDILRNEHHLRNNNVDVDEIRQDINETIQRIKSEIIEDVGVLQEPASNVTSDPLTPLDQNFVTFDHLNDHYRLFLNRIQQQLTTLGGGGEYRLQYLDDIVGIATNASAYDGKYLRYNHSLKKFEFVTVSGGAGSQTLDQTLALGNSSNAGMTVGVSTFNNVVVGGSNTALVVNGNARITGILTIGTGSITLNGTNDSIRIGTGLTITSAGNANYSGVITATSFVGSAASLTGLTGAAANTYGNATTVPQIVVDGNGRITSISNVSISAGGGGGTGINVRDNGSVIGFAGTVDFGAGIDATTISSGITTVSVSYAPVAGIATTATSAYNLFGTPNLNVGVLTATTLNGSGINLTGIVTSIVAGAGITINQSTGRIIITSIGGTVGTYATVGYVDQQISSLIGGAPAILDTLNELALALNDDANFASSIAATLSNKLDLTGGTISGSLQALGGFVGNLTGTASNATVAGYAKTAGIATVSGYATNAGVATYAVNAGVATYAPSAGIATYTPLAGLSTYATNSGVSTYAVSAGVATNAYTAGIATNSQYAFVAGVSTNAFVAGIATYATSAGVATNAYNAGIATYATSAGVATNAYNAGIATYATVAGVATNAFTAGIATNAQFATVATNAFNAGVATVAVNAYSSGIATNAFTAGVSTNAFNAGIATYAVTAGVATNAFNAGIATVATNAYNAGVATVAINAYNAGVATVAINAYNSGIATYAVTAGVATYATISGVSTYSTSAGVATNAYTAGIATYAVTAGVATNAYTAGIATVAQGLTGTPNLNVGIVTATSYNGSGSNLTGLTGAAANTYGNATTVPQIVVDGNGRITSISNVLISGGGGGGGTGVNVKNLGSVVGFAGTIDFGTGLTVTPVSAGVVTVTASGGGSGQYSAVAGIATYATTAGVATYAATSGVSTYATSAGVATNAYNAGIATYATTAGVATNAFNAGIATYSTSSGVATNAYNAGIATYAVTAGIATSVIGGIASVTALNVSGISTFSNNVRVSGFVTASSILVSNDGGNNGSVLIQDTGAYSEITFRASNGTDQTKLQGVEGNLYITPGSGGFIALSQSTYNLFYDNGNVILNNGANGTTTLSNGAQVTGLLQVTGLTSTTTLRVGTGGTIINTTSAGFVGIGTTNPTDKLTVKGTSALENLTVSGIATFGSAGGNAGVVDVTSNSSRTYISPGAITFNNGEVADIQKIDSATIFRGKNQIQLAAYAHIGGFGYKTFFVDSNGPTELYYGYLNKKFETIGAGVTVYGTTFTNQLNVSGVVTATSFVGDGSQLTGVVGSANTSNIRTNSLNVSGVSTFAGITTITGENLFTKQFNVSGVSTFNSNVTINGTASATSFSGSGSNLTGLTGASANTYGNASAVPQIVVDSNGRITSITNVAISGGGGGGGTGVNIKSVGSVVGFAGTIDFGLGLSVTPVSAGIVTVNNDYSATAGIATNVIGGISSVTALNVSGLSTFAGITTVTGPNLFTKQLNVSGVATFNNSLKILDSTFTGTYEPSRIQFRTGEVVIDSVSHTLRFQPSTTADFGSILFFSRTGATAGSLRFRNSAILDFDLNGSINIAGVSTFAGITTVTGETLFAKQVNVSGAATVSRLVSSGASLTNPVFSGLTTAIDGIRIAQATGASQYVHNIGPWYIAGYDTAAGYQNDQYLQFSAINSNYILKNVGIGTTNPTSALTVKGTSALENVTVSGVSTFAGITTITGQTLFAKQLNVSGVGTFRDDLVLYDSTNPVAMWDSSQSRFELNDNISIVFGNSSELQMYYLGPADQESVIASYSNRPLNIKTSPLSSSVGGAITRLTVSNNGINVSGSTTTSTLNVSGISSFTGAVSCASTVSFGTTAYFDADDEIVLNNKFKIYNNGSNTLLKNFDTNTGGDLYIQSDVILLQKYDGTETIARFTEGAGVELNYQGQTRLTTIDDGVIVGSNAAGVVHIPNELRIGTVAANQSNASIMIANSSGVGIGTTNPTGRLTVKGTSALDNLTVSGVSTFTNGPIFVGTANSTGTASQPLQVTGGAYVSGRLGIGTTNPVGTVQVGTAATQSVVISGVGSVGVGTINPVSSFQVEQYAIENFTGSFTASPGVAANIDAFTISVTDFKAVEYTLHFAYATNIQAQKVLVMQNGTTAYAQEYAIMSDPNLIVSIGATVTAGVCYLQATPEAGISGVTTYRLVRSGML